MKKMILPVFILMSSLVISQESPTRITGIGKLKLGDNISLINDLGYPIVNVKDYSEISKNKANICRLIADTNATSYQPTLYAKTDPRCKVYTVPKINIGVDIIIENVQLYFFNDSLVKIVCDSDPKLIEAMTLKYGKSNLKSRKRTGDSDIYEDVTYYDTWKIGETGATRYLYVTYSKEHEESISSSFQVLNEITMDMIDKESKLIEERAKQRELEKKKKSIEGF
jgi:hypothetical protein